MMSLPGLDGSRCPYHSEYSTVSSHLEYSQITSLYAINFVNTSISMVIVPQQV